MGAPGFAPGILGLADGLGLGDGLVDPGGAGEGVFVGVLGATWLGDAEGVRVGADPPDPAGGPALPHAASKPSTASEAMVLTKAGRLLMTFAPAEVVKRR